MKEKQLDGLERLHGNNKNKTCVINDPLGQTHSPTSSDLYFHVTFVLFCDILDGRTEICAKIIYRPGLWVGRVDQNWTKSGLCMEAFFPEKGH